MTLSDANSFRMVEIFGQCPDPRKCRIRHKLTDVIAIVMFGTICGEEGWDGFVDWATDKKIFLSKYLSLDNGIPSSDTLRRVLERLNPDHFLQAFITWSEELAKRLPGQICIDGKSFKRCNKGKGNLHIVNAWCESNSMTLASVASDKKGKEIPCIKELLENLCLCTGDVVTIDAIGCQKDIVQKIHDKGADYIIALKANQGNLRNEAENFFRQAMCAPEYAPCEIFKYMERGNDEHEIWISTDIEWLETRENWTSLNSIAMVKRKWQHKGKLKEDTRYYITSLCESAEKLGHKIRRHWSIENEYHWYLDVVFGEDSSLISGKANRNLRIARELALTLLKREASSKMGLKRKMRRCARSDEYFQKVLSTENI